MTSGQPRIGLEELLLEAKLTRTPFLIVEGPDDRRFYSQWLRTVRLPEAAQTSPLTLLSVEKIEIDAGALLVEGINEGAKGRVLYVALKSEGRDARLMCIADLDCGYEKEEYSCENLWWTDFPAIESYAFDAEVLDVLNQSFLKEKLPPGSELVRSLYSVLFQMYFVRNAFRDIEEPNVAGGFGKSKDPSDFSIHKAVDPGTASKTEVPPHELPPEPRMHAYGHDLGNLLMHLYGNAIKNSAGVSDVEALERLLRASIVMSGVFGKSPLAGALLTWLTGPPASGAQLAT